MKSVGFVRDEDGKPIMERVIDEQWGESVLDAFRLYTDSSWSLDRVAVLFNERGVGGQTNWDASKIARLLEREIYHGVEYYGMTYQKKDPVTGKTTIHKRPKEQWQRREVPHLRIVPEDLGKRTKARRKLSREAFAKARSGDKPSRVELHPQFLVRPYCGCCKAPLILGRSGKYASYFCHNGKTGKKGCTFRGYKTARIIDTAVLEQVAQVVFTDDFMRTVVDEANAAVKNRSVPNLDCDVAALKVLIQKKSRAIETITKKLETAANMQRLEAVFKHVDVLQAEVDAAKERLAAAMAIVQTPPITVTLEMVQQLLGGLRELLQADVGTAAPILAQMTGRVLVTKGQNESGEPEWRGQFLLDAVSALLSLAISRACPSQTTWAYLQQSKKVIGGRQSAWLRPIPKHSLLSEQVAALAAKGLSYDVIARKLSTTWTTVRVALDYAAAGVTSPKPYLPVPEPFRKGQQLGPEVEARIVAMREKNIPFQTIARKLKINKTTASRAYERCTGRRGRYRNLPAKVFATIRKLLEKDKTIEEIAQAAGCSKNTVSRYKKELSEKVPRAIS